MNNNDKPSSYRSYSPHPHSPSAACFPYPSPAEFSCWEQQEGEVPPVLGFGHE